MNEYTTWNFSLRGRSLQELSDEGQLALRTLPLYVVQTHQSCTASHLVLENQFVSLLILSGSQAHLHPSAVFFAYLECHVFPNLIDEYFAPFVGKLSQDKAILILDNHCLLVFLIRWLQHAAVEWSSSYAVMFSLGPSRYCWEKAACIFLVEIGVLCLIEFDEIFGDEWSKEKEVLY